MIAADILLEELLKRNKCESCQVSQSEYLYLNRLGFCSVLCHVCSGCKDELEKLLDGTVKEFMLKDPLPKKYK